MRDNQNKLGFKKSQNKTRRFDAQKLARLDLAAPLLYPLLKSGPRYACQPTRSLS